VNPVFRRWMLLILYYSGMKFVFVTKLFFCTGFDLTSSNQDELGFFFFGLKGEGDLTRLGYIFYDMFYYSGIGYLFPRDCIKTLIQFRFFYPRILRGEDFGTLWMCEMFNVQLLEKSVIKTGLVGVGAVNVQSEFILSFVEQDE